MVGDENLSKSHNPECDDDSEAQSTTANADFDRSASEDLSITAFSLVDELFIEIFDIVSYICILFVFIG